MDLVLVEVATTSFLPQNLSYLAPHGVEKGMRVIVPLGPRKVLALIFKVEAYLPAQEKKEGKGFKLKKVHEILDEKPFFQENWLQLALWASSYYLCPLSEVVRSSLKLAFQNKQREYYELSPLGKKERQATEGFAAELLQVLFPQQRKVLKTTFVKRLKAWQEKLHFAAPKDPEKYLLAKELILFESQKELAKRGEQEKSIRIKTQNSSKRAPVSWTHKLNSEQETVLEALKTSVEKSWQDDCAPKPQLLFGVTGSGKTEVYLRLIDWLLSSYLKEQNLNAQVLVLVPEISLTPQMTAVFSKHFSGQIALCHSTLSERQKWTELERIRLEKAQILIGPRSALLAPFAKLKLIIVDEEHDTSYKQQSSFCYHGRDLAIVRARFEKALCVLGSATPSLESFHNGQRGKYQLLSLPKRVSTYKLPSCQLERLRSESRAMNSEALDSLGAQSLKHSKLLSAKMLTAIQETLEKKEQVMLLVSRRGYAHYLLKPESREPVSCPACSISLTLHQHKRSLSCHYCGYSCRVQDIASSAKEQFISVGSGSEKIEAFLQEYFPEARVARLDSEVSSSAAKLMQCLNDFREQKTDILVGTQILAKGHDFPAVSLVCMLEVDQMLDFPDFRAGEKTIQLMIQAAGRAGRADRPGKVMMQSFRPEHRVLELGLNYDFSGFAKKELAFRQLHAYPPFTRVILFEFSAPFEDELEALVRNLQSYLEQEKRSKPELFHELRLLGPCVPALARIRSQFRRCLLCLGTKVSSLQFFAKTLRQQEFLRSPRLRLRIDVDPQNLI